MFQNQAYRSPQRNQVSRKGLSFVASCVTGERIKEALFSRLGNERFAVWFGDNFEVHVTEAVARREPLSGGCPI